VKKFVIFCLGRSGSTLLESLLDSHPQIRCEGELLVKVAWEGWKRPLLRVLRHYPFPLINLRIMLAKRHHHILFYGFKLQMFQAANPFNILMQMHKQGWHVLYLSRNDLFAQTLSVQIAHMTNRWHGSIHPSEVDTYRQNPSLLTLDPEQFRTALTSWRTYNEKCIRIAETVPHLSLVYENHLANPSQWGETMAQICAYLELDPAPIHTELTKPWDRPYSELVVNYVELVEVYQDWLNCTHDQKTT
jgi:LPS sulfotransferase NodH